MRISRAAVIALLAVAPPAARAEPVLGLRLGVAAALGSAAADLPMQDVVSLELPVQLDGLWRFHQWRTNDSVAHLAAGAYGSFGPAFSGSCDGACASVARAGIQAIWTFAPSSGLDAWAGLAAGYEWAKEGRGSGASRVTTSWRGFDLLTFQGGVDGILGQFTLGPFLSVSLVRYTDVAVETAVESASTSLGRRAFHAWLQAGLCARFAKGDRR